MGRPKQIIRVTKKTLHIPTDINDKIEAILIDNRTGQIPRGKYSNLVVKLFREYLEKRDRAHGK